MLPNSHSSPLTHATHSVLNLMYPAMQDVQTDGADASHRKHPLLRSSRAHALAGHLVCVVDVPVIETYLLLYLAMTAPMSRQLLLRYLRDKQR